MASARKQPEAGGKKTEAASGVPLEQAERIRRQEETIAALEGQLRERTRQLEAARQEMDAFSFSVSHDLRAPLRSIDAFTQLVLDEHGSQLDAQPRQYLEIVRQATRKLAAQIDALLQLSRSVRGEFRRQTVDMSGLAGQLIVEARKAEPQRSVEAVVPPGLSARADEKMIRTALGQLFKNAWKFTSRQPSARVEFGAERQNGEMVWFVADNGAGFDMSYANKLFGAFQRLHPTNEFPGEGVGLAIAQRIIHRHGGRIWATASVEQGATFYFTLPESE